MARVFPVANFTSCEEIQISYSVFLSGHKIKILFPTMETPSSPFQPNNKAFDFSITSSGYLSKIYRLFSGKSLYFTRDRHYAEFPFPWFNPSMLIRHTSCFFADNYCI